MGKTIDELVGKRFKFFGVDSNCFKIGSRIFEAIEDECDGYRSMLLTVCLADNTKPLIFSQLPLDTITVKEDEEYRGYKLVGRNGHVWLRIGTYDYDDYYPCFRFEYTPSAPKPTR
jgi:hypothetical protein